jgi:hypothetical protein
VRVVTPLSIQAPTDAQLDYIRVLCETRGWPAPAAVHSKQEASEIISGIQAGTYEPGQHEPAGGLDAWGLPSPDYDPDDVPF